MFSVDFLHQARELELELIAKHLVGARSVLEVGGGTGYQAKRLTEMGMRVTSIDLEQSNYRNQKVFPVQSYDGKTLPFQDRSFDVVFTSNVLEHVADLAVFHNESRRVLNGDGYCVHVVPSSSWRFWTSIAHYPDLLRRCIGVVSDGWRRGPADAHRSRAWLFARAVYWPLRVLWRERLPPRHGEFGNAVSELWRFSRWHWRSHFRQHGFDVIATSPTRLFYTGHVLAGARWSIASRQRAARLLGSSGMLYKVRPRDRISR